MKSFSQQIQESVAGIALVRRVYCFDEIPSTSDWARDMILRAGPEADVGGTLVVAAHQTAGRGRQQRAWSAPPGKALLFSMILGPNIAPGDEDDFGQLLVSAAPVAVCAGISGVTGLKPSIKYPNDIYLSAKKTAGILLERVAVGSRQWFIVGIGINVKQNTDELPSDARITPTSLFIETGKEIDIAIVLAPCLQNLAYNLVPGNRQKVFATMNSLCDTVGRQVSVDLTSETVEGTAMSVSANGGLIIRLPSGIQREIFSGDIRQLNCPRA